jgi:iron complex transport system ATP-binding protein
MNPGMNSETLFTCEAAQIGYRQHRRERIVLRDVAIEGKAGSVMILLGRNGAGKSSLLRTLAGVQKPLGGSIVLQGEPLAALSPRQIATRIAWVTPLRDLAPGLTGFDVVALGRQPHTPWHGRLSAHDLAVIETAITECGAEAFALRPMTDLSDGERQRLLLAKALAQETRIVLLDEPTAFLDRPGRTLVFRLAKQWAQQKGCCVLISTHDIELALTHGHHGLLLQNGQCLQGPCHDPAFVSTVDRAFAD